jgi:hypothetical protein
LQPFGFGGLGFSRERMSQRRYGPLPPGAELNKQPMFPDGVRNETITSAPAGVTTASARIETTSARTAPC